MSAVLPSSADVVVGGAGNAAFCAGLAAAEQGVSVLMLERAPEEETGGNSRFTAGAFRCVYNGVEDLRALMPDLTDEEVSKSDFGTGGTGLMNGSVSGGIAGTTAGQRAAQSP